MQLPPEAMQALQQQQAGGADITGILAQLAQMSPEEVSAALAQLGVQVDPEQLQEAASDWVEQSADKASGDAEDGEQSADAAAEGASDEAPVSDATPSAPPTADDEATTAADAEQSEAMEAQAQASPAEAAMAAASSSGGGSMPSNRMPSGGGGGRMPPMDDLVSAQLMQGAAGSPNAPVPQVAGAQNFTRMRVPGGLPRSQSGAASGSPEMKDMIANLYRQISAQSNTRAGVPTGPRTGAPAQQRRSRKSYV